MKPLVSIVMPTYNRQHYLAEAIQSCLNQSYKNIELIIVDDGSTDHTEKLVSYYQDKDDRVKYIKLPTNMGISFARNNGVDDAEGEYIAVMDSDDVMNPDRIKLSVKAIKGHNFVYGSYYMTDDDLEIKSIYIPNKKITLEDVKNDGAYPHITIMAERHCFERHPYRDDFRANDDSFLVWNFFKNYDGRLIKPTRKVEALCKVRFHAENVSTQKKKEIERTQQIMNGLYEEYEKNNNNSRE